MVLTSGSSVPRGFPLVPIRMINGESIYVILTVFLPLHLFDLLFWWKFSIFIKKCLVQIFYLVEIYIRANFLFRRKFAILTRISTNVYGQDMMPIKFKCWDCEIN